MFKVNENETVYHVSLTADDIIDMCNYDTCMAIEKTRVLRCYDFGVMCVPKSIQRKMPILLVYPNGMVSCHTKESI